LEVIKCVTDTFSNNDAVRKEEVMELERAYLGILTPKKSNNTYFPSQALISTTFLDPKTTFFRSLRPLTTGGFSENQAKNN